MKQFTNAMILAAAISVLGLSQVNAAGPDSPKIRVVNFKTCVEESKLGKQEQSSFEALKKQMEGVLSEKEKTLNELATKFEDPDYLDSLSPEAETEMKRKFRNLNQEFTQLQSQYMQSLQQTNFKVVQKLTDTVTKASKEVAERQGVDLILNEEGIFYVSSALDISKQVVTVMDQSFEKDASDAKSNGTTSPVELKPAAPGPTPAAPPKATPVKSQPVTK